MNGRGVIYKTLAEDDDLKALGVQVFPNFGFEDAPRAPFVILRFMGGNGGRIARREPRFLEVGVHIPTEISRDFDDVDEIVGLVVDILENIEQERLGEEWVTSIRCTGIGADTEDTGYNSITRSAGFTILAG